MKKQMILFLFLMVSIVASAQVTILMEKEGGVYKVPCNVNGVKMKFVFDTGAASVSMSQTMAQFLLDGEYLSATDIKGIGQSVVADGTIVNHAIVILRDIEIGGLHLKNIKATVLESQNSPLLLGQTAISELGRITIDGNKLIIHTGDNELTEEQVDQLVEQAEKYIKAKSYSAAIECLERIDEKVGLSEYGLYSLCYCYFQNDQNSQCIQSCNRWITEFERLDEYGDKVLIYGYLACSYRKLEDYEKAILWFQKESSLLENERDLMVNKRKQAECYYFMGKSHKAKDMYWEYLDYTEKELGYSNEHTYKNIRDGLVHNKDLGLDYYGYALILYEVGDKKAAVGFVIDAAQLGCEIARKQCRNNGFLEKISVNWNFK